MIDFLTTSFTTVQAHSLSAMNGLPASTLICVEAPSPSHWTAVSVALFHSRPISMTPFIPSPVASPSRWWQHGPRVHFTYPYEAFNPFLGKDHEKEEVSILQEES